MQTDPVVQSQIHDSAVVSQAQPPQPDALTGCLSVVSQLVPEAHLPQPVCPQTPGNWRHPVSECSVSEGSVLDTVCPRIPVELVHPVAHPLSEPVQSPDGSREMPNYDAAKMSLVTSKLEKVLYDPEQWQNQ